MHGEHAPRSHGHPQHAHPSEGDDRAPLVHRFDRQQANTWAKRFEGPERDRYQQPAKVVAAMALQPQMRVADIGAGTGYMALDALRTGTSASRKFLYSAGIVVGMLSTVPAIEIFHPAKSLPIAYVIYGPIFGGAFLLVFLLRESWIRR